MKWFHPMEDGAEAVRSLPEVHRSIEVPRRTSWWRLGWVFAGPGFLVSVGYMDPGNWGTDLAGGSQFGYSLLWVILLSSLIAQFLQILSARLGLATGKDLAICCRDCYQRPVAVAMWILAEIAIFACDLAEVVGSAVALKLLFGIPLELGVLITAFDVLLLLAFMRFGFRKIEAVVLTMVMTVSVCFAYELALVKPAIGPIVHGSLVPQLPNLDAALISLGILGATVMPHNLFLHSSIVQTRKTGQTDGEVRHAMRFNFADTVVALSLAFLVNAAILVLAAAVFGTSHQVVTELEQGHDLLRSTLGGASATVFAVALLASGQSSTITGTLAGQVVMEGFMRWKLAPWVRRTFTRVLAIVPTLLFIHLSGGGDTVRLLIYSQVVLSMQLPFAVFPLIAVTSDPACMGAFVNPRWVKALGYFVGIVIAVCNAYLLGDMIGWWALAGVVALIGGFAAWVTRRRPTGQAA